MMFIDCEDTSVLMPFTTNILEAAEIAKKEHGRLRLVVGKDIDVTDPMVGCVELCDYRRPAPQSPSEPE